MNDKTNRSEQHESVVDNPSVQTSLQQLAETEQTENKTISRIHTVDSVKNIVEAAIHAAGKAISLDKLSSLFPDDEVIEKSVLRQAIEQLIQDYQDKGVELVEVSSGFRFQVAQSVAPWVSRLWEEKPQKYSRALLETLALIAYRQPITRGEIEEIRGVSVSSQIIRTLVEREWIRVIGHRDVPGKPAMYATTRQFLDYFSLKKLDELPSLSEIRDLDVINAELDFDLDSSQNEDAQAEQENAEPKASEQSDVDKESDTDKESDVAENVISLDSNDGEQDEHIDIDVELAALKETYQQIDSLNKQEKEIIAEAGQNAVARQNAVAKQKVESELETDIEQDNEPGNTNKSNE